MPLDLKLCSDDASLTEWIYHFSRAGWKFDSRKLCRLNALSTAVLVVRTDINGSAALFTRSATKNVEVNKISVRAVGDRVWFIVDVQIRAVRMQICEHVQTSSVRMAMLLSSSSTLTVVVCREHSVLLSV